MNGRVDGRGGSSFVIVGTFCVGGVAGRAVSNQDAVRRTRGRVTAAILQATIYHPGARNPTKPPKIPILGRLPPTCGAATAAFGDTNTRGSGRSRDRSHHHLATHVHVVARVVSQVVAQVVAQVVSQVVAQVVSQVVSQAVAQVVAQLALRGRVSRKSCARNRHDEASFRPR